MSTAGCGSDIKEGGKMKIKRIKWSARALFLMVEEKLKKDGLIPDDILDYSIAGSDSEMILSEEFDVIPRIVHGSNEGIYMDIILDAGNHPSAFSNREPYIRLGTFKTLQTDKDAYIKMSVLGAEVVYAVRVYVQENMDEFNWTGFDLTFYHGEKRMLKMWVLKYEQAMERAKTFIKKHDSGSYVKIRNNETEKEEAIRFTSMTA